MTTHRLPKLPSLLDRKIYKTGQTRGADDDVIYQNRVARSSTVLIPYACWDSCCTPQDEAGSYENGFIVLLTPSEYFDNPSVAADLSARGLAIGKNALVFYETREQWNRHNPDDLKWRAATSRNRPLGGKYVARVAGTTATAHGDKIVRGFSSTSRKGAGIRVYEYASTLTIAACRLQLEALFWLCDDAEAVVVRNGMTAENVAARKAANLAQCQEQGLLDKDRLAQARILNTSGTTICPLCLEELPSQGFFDRMQQAEGRLVNDLTVTQLNLFHVEELRVGVLSHRPYNVGWGHHHCNVVVRDSGVQGTLEWMKSVVDRNTEQGYFWAANNPI